MQFKAYAMHKQFKGNQKTEKKRKLIRGKLISNREPSRRKNN